MRRPLQFRLRSMFAMTAVAALLLGLWRLIGSRLGLGLVLGVEMALPVVWRPRRLYAWFLPLLWTTIAWNNFTHRGDEYGSFFSGSLAGLWIIAIVGSAGSTGRSAALVVIAGAGTLAVAGWLLDKLRAPFIPWSVLSLVTAAGLFTWWLGSFPTLERALAKNGSLEAYILPALNLGLTFATVVMFVTIGLYRLWQQFFIRVDSGPTS